MDANRCAGAQARHKRRKECVKCGRGRRNTAISHRKRQEFDAATGAKGWFGAEFKFGNLGGFQQRHHRGKALALLLPHFVLKPITSAWARHDRE